MAGEAENLEVVLTVMATPENGELVMHLEWAPCPSAPAGLAAGAASGHEGPPARRGEWLHSSSSVVCLLKLGSRAALPDEW